MGALTGSNLPDLSSPSGSHLFNRALGISNTTSRVLMMGWCWVLAERCNSTGQQKPLVVGRRMVFTREDFLCPSAPTLTTSPTP